MTPTISSIQIHPRQTVPTLPIQVSGASPSLPLLMACSVTEDIYQARGVNFSNTTVIEGNQGIIVIDPLTSMETGAAANELYQNQFGPKDIKAVIYTHSHVDMLSSSW